MDFGLTFEKLLVIGVIAAFIIGPERLPGVAEKFAGLVRKAGTYLRDTKTRMKEEFGDDIDDVDWRKLDPRQYDPRRIIRDALLEEPTPEPVKPVSNATAVAGTAAAGATLTAETSADSPGTPAPFSAENPPPFDVDAT